MINFKESQIGLSTTEVQDRIQKGLTNTAQQSISRTKGQILKENICTLFNLLNILIAIALALVGAWTNIVFIFIIITNVLIGIIQELRAKKLIDELSLLMIPSVKVIRDGKEESISCEDLVIDDVMILDSGQQISCDAIVIDGEIEANESLLTGESDPIHKGKEAMLLSGSSVISGKCYAKVIHVGNENYVSKISNEVKKSKAIQSELLDSMKKVTRVTSFMIIPLGIILFVEAYLLRDNSLADAVVSSSAGLLGMLPKGLFLLISVSLATGVSKLAKQKILIQDLYSLETLAHVDTLCLDKTGTITNGKMKVENIYPLTLTQEEEFNKYFGSYLHYSDDNNMTYQALCDHFILNDLYQPISKVPFSSIRKWSSMTFENYGTLVMGAPDRLVNSLPTSLIDEMNTGKRVIMIAHTKEVVNAKDPLPQLTPLVAVILTDTIRKDVNKTLDYFRQEGVDVKIISGDHITAVSAIAKQAGLENYDKCLDMSCFDSNDENFDNLVNEYSVFGRVTPNQKRLLVQALQRQGHKVAMTGDGVNDMLALREADCSIAIAEGSEAVKQLSQIVLLNSDFSCLPNVVLEGRRVVNNVTRVASVFFIKTIYSILLTLVCALMNIPFPFIPIQITLIDLAIEAFPAFLTLLEPNVKKIQGKFLPTVFKASIPNGLGVLACILIIEFIAPSLNIHSSQASTMMYLCVALISMQAVIISCIPMNQLRLFVCICMVGGFVLAILLFHSLLHLVFLPYQLIILTMLITLSGLLFKEIIRGLLPKFIKSFN